MFSFQIICKTYFAGFARQKRFLNEGERLKSLSCNFFAQMYKVGTSILGGTPFRYIQRFFLFLCSLFYSIDWDFFFSFDWLFSFAINQPINYAEAFSIFNLLNFPSFKNNSRKHALFTTSLLLQPYFKKNVCTFTCLLQEQKVGRKSMPASEFG